MKTKPFNKDTIKPGAKITLSSNPFEDDRRRFVGMTLDGRAVYEMTGSSGTAYAYIADCKQLLEVLEPEKVKIYVFRSNVGRLYATTSLSVNDGVWKLIKTIEVELDE